MFWGAEGVLINKTLKFSQATQVTYSAILFLKFNRIAIIVNSEGPFKNSNFDFDNKFCTREIFINFDQ